jgi:sigma-B regulation protein RsbU (phosphoserine phosphatase)
MLPSAEPDFTNQPCYDLAASMRPAKEIGGDFYDFFMLSDDKLAFLIADVSGKGVPAALVMAIGKTMLKNYMKETGNIADAFRITNNVLLDNNSESMFITAYACVLDLRTGELQYVNAGHEDPFIKCSDGEFVLRKERHAIVLGAMENMKYKVHTTKLQPGDRIYMYTDGVPEAHDAELQMFGMEGTSDVLNSVKDEKASDVIDAVCKSVVVFAKGAPQFDDMTMLCLDFRQYYTDDMAKDGE